MAKTPVNELFSTLKSYINQLSDGERTPNEVASALNGWARESAESVKAKVAEEVEAQVRKMGFIKRDEYEKLLARVDKLERTKSPSKKVSTTRSSSVGGAKKEPATKNATKNAVKKVSKK